MAASDKKLVRSKSGLRIIGLNETLTSPFFMEEPPWSPDNECVECLSCKQKFDFFNRRHHCRRCGQCFCGKCCSQNVELSRMCFVDPVRHCNGCAVISKKEMEFFQTHAKALVSGASFHLTSTAFAQNENSPMYLAYLSSDHRLLKLECGDSKMNFDPIELKSVMSANILTANADVEGNIQPSGITMKYKDSEGCTQTVTLTVMDSSLKRQSILWIAAMQRALKLLLGKSPPGSVATP